jgi:hypothetical protein
VSLRVLPLPFFPSEPCSAVGVGCRRPEPAGMAAQHESTWPGPPWPTWPLRWLGPLCQPLWLG